jgi:membrane-associated protein
MVSDLMHALVGIPSPVLLVVIGGLVFGEAAVFLGFVLPGETAVLLGGFLASTGRLSVVLLAVIVVVAAIVGDSVGYYVGRRFGPKLARTRLLRKHEGRLEGARRFLDGRGGSAVFIGRFTAFLRAVMPGMAGLSRMHYQRFLAWNALGGVVWGVGCVIVGYVAGSSYEQVGQWIGRTGAIIVGVLVLLLLVVWHRRRKHARSDGSTRFERMYR